MSICSIVLQKLSIYSHLRPFSATFVLRMRRNSYVWTFGVNLDTAVRFPYPDFLLDCKISAIWRQGGQKLLHFWNPRPRFANSLYNFYWVPTAINGRLLSCSLMLKPFTCEKNCPVKTRRKIAVLFGKMGVKTLDICSANPKRHSLARNRVVWRILRQNRCKVKHRRSIRRPRLPIRVQNFGDSATFSVDFCILYLNVRHISTSGLFDLLT